MLEAGEARVGPNEDLVDGLDRLILAFDPLTEGLRRRPELVAIQLFPRAGVLTELVETDQRLGT